MVKASRNSRFRLRGNKKWHAFIANSLMRNIASSIQLFIYPLRDVKDTRRENTAQRFFSAFLGSFVGLTTAISGYAAVTNLLPALISFLNTFNVNYSAGLAIIIFPLVVVASVAGYVISESSSGKSTLITLFFRGLIFQFMLIPTVLAVGLVLYLAKWLGFLQ
jgi:hypothetical protein